MNLTTTIEHRFERTPDWAVWTQTMFAYVVWVNLSVVTIHFRQFVKI